MKRDSRSYKGGKTTGSRITTAVAIRLACVVLLWLVLVWLVIKGRPLTLWTLFVVIASGIVVFVPLYKKYVRDTTDK